ncbi:Reverse transcriptase domain-containing protein [Aphis craccivora]|uniref:Reverse transcriptase domain-containing protein n=1 Tax=Aphis craccivora TaxID=307492 RepID=A0A6G0YI00_APHCR|nr:Reverse transcriptase domain-containing protein [Aphis craccivora]
MVILGRTTKNVLNLLRIQHNSIICIFFKKKNIIGFTCSNYKEFNILSLVSFGLQYKKKCYMFVYKKSMINIKTSFGQKFIITIWVLLFLTLCQYRCEKKYFY